MKLLRRSLRKSWLPFLTPTFQGLKHCARDRKAFVRIAISGQSPGFWELIEADSELTGYKLIKVQLGHQFLHLPERSRFNRGRRNERYASEKLRRILVKLLPDAEVFIVHSFPIPLCDFKRAATSKSPLKCADGTGTLATYGKCATKGLDTFLGFRCPLTTTSYGLPVDFAVATADTDDRKVLPLLCERGTYPIILGDKGYISEDLEAELLQTYNVRLLPTRRPNQKTQYPFYLYEAGVLRRWRGFLTSPHYRNIFLIFIQGGNTSILFVRSFKTCFNSSSSDIHL